MTATTLARSLLAIVVGLPRLPRRIAEERRAHRALRRVPVARFNFGRVELDDRARWLQERMGVGGRGA